MRAITFAALLYYYLFSIISYLLSDEATYEVSKADFIAKLQISLKETAETEYWLRLLVLSDYITEAEGDSLISDCLEIKRILIATLNTAKQNNSLG